MICDGDQHQAKLDSPRVTKGKMKSRCSSHADSRGVSVDEIPFNAAGSVLGRQLHAALRWSN
jgi:hypothetical protein